MQNATCKVLSKVNQEKIMMMVMQASNEMPEITLNNVTVLKYKRHPEV